MLLVGADSASMRNTTIKKNIKHLHVINRRSSISGCFFGAISKIMILDKLDKFHIPFLLGWEIRRSQPAAGYSGMISGAKSANMVPNRPAYYYIHALSMPWYVMRHVTMMYRLKRMWNIQWLKPPTSDSCYIREHLASKPWINWGLSKNLSRVPDPSRSPRRRSGPRPLLVRNPWAPGGATERFCATRFLTKSYPT